jgi:pimeloyl-ACP methyl ester carboxylesterase
VSLTALLLGVGCQRPLTWAQRTHELDRVFLADGRTDRRLVYRDVGDPNAATTLLLVHGATGSKADWVFVAPRLRDAARIVVVDLLGAGDSSKPAEHDYAMSSQARYLGQLIRQRDLRNLVIVGVSYGGGVALELGLDLCTSAERDRLRGLVLLDPAALDFPPHPAHAVLVGSPLVRGLAVLFGTGDPLARVLLAGTFYRDADIPPELLLDWSQRLDALDARAAAAQTALGLFRELRARVGQEQRYARVDCPVLILRGDHDVVVPASVSERLAAILPHARVQVIAECGHTPNHERPAETARAVRQFVDEAARGAAARAGDEP